MPSSRRAAARPASLALVIFHGFACTLVASYALAADPPAHKREITLADRLSLSDVQAINDATKIVFICEGSAGVKPQMDTLREQLHRAVKGMPREGQFNVIFVRDNSLAMAFPRLTAADDDGRKRAYAFLAHFTPGGKNDPLPALRAAFAQKPQMIYLLAAGPYPDAKGVVAELATLNADRKVIVNTIAFLNHGEEYEATLHQIARAYNGLFRFVSEEDLKETDQVTREKEKNEAPPHPSASPR